MKMVSISLARKEWANLLEFVSTTKEPVYITRYNKPVAVLVPAEEPYLMPTKSPENKDNSQD